MDDEKERLDKHFTLRISSRLYGAVVRRAKATRRQPADWIRVIIEEAVEREEQRQ